MPYASGLEVIWGAATRNQRELGISLLSMLLFLHKAFYESLQKILTQT